MLIDAKAQPFAGSDAALVPQAELTAGARGALLAPNADLASLAPYLSGLQVIAIEFPKFRDGRGFSLARALREHFGYQGELRAVGHFLPDQFFMLVSCGFTSFETPAEHDPAQFAAELAKPRQPGQLLRRSLSRALEN